MIEARPPPGDSEAAAPAVYRPNGAAADTNQASARLHLGITPGGDRTTGAGLESAALAYDVVALAPVGDTARHTVLRTRLAIARDWASRELHYASEHAQAAHQCHFTILDTAARLVFAPVSVDVLELAVATCRRLLICASNLDTLEGGGR